MKRIPVVAVVTRTKDRPHFLRRALKSVHSQSYHNFIHVIINDAGEPDVVDKIVADSKSVLKGEVRVIHNKSSKGMEAASNKAIKSVESKYIAIHDDDDTWHKDFLKEAVNHLETSGQAGVVVTTDRVLERVEENTIVTLETTRWLPDIEVINIYKQCQINHATPITFLYSRKVYEELGGYDEDLPVAGDWDFALRFLLAYDIDFLKTKKALAYYHHRLTASGTDQNSVFINNGLAHKQYINKLANYHLRKELKSGKLGIGYLINLQLANADQEQKLNKKIDDTTRYLSNEVTGRSNNVQFEINQQLVELRMAVHQGLRRKTLLHKAGGRLKRQIIGKKK